MEPKVGRRRGLFIDQDGSHSPKKAHFMDDESEPSAKTPSPKKRILSGLDRTYMSEMADIVSSRGGEFLPDFGLGNNIGALTSEECKGNGWQKILNFC